MISSHNLVYLSKNMIQLKVCLKLKEARINAGFTQKQVSGILHYDRSTLAYKESGKIPIYAWELIELCNLYKISPNDLIDQNRRG